MRVLLRVVAAMIAAAGTQANAAWLEARSPHFIIYANENPNDLKLYAQNLERFDQSARHLVGLPDPPLTDAGRVTIFVLPSLGAVSKLVGLGYAAGLYVGRASGSYAFVPDLRGLSSDYSQVIFFHEYTHHLQLQGADYPVPQWYREGFADFMSTAEINSDGSVTFGKLPPGREWDAIHQNVLPLNQVVGETYTHLNDQTISYLYSRGWLLTDYLTVEPSRSNQLNVYLAAIAKGAKPIDAAKSAFGDLNKLERELENYANSGALRGFKVSASAISVGPVALRQLTPGEAAIIDVRVHSKRGVDSKTAPVVAAEARKIALQYPNDGVVQSCLAEAEYDAQDYPAARQAVDRALTADPQDAHALIYKGMIETALARANPDQANWEAIRSWFIKANKLDTEDAEPLALYYDTYRVAHQQPTQNAVDALLYAASLAPQDEGVRMEAVQELLSEGKAAVAKKAFGLIAYQPHLSSAGREWADKIMQAMDQGDAQAALALTQSLRPTAAAQKKN